jgi:hypothetical protein
VRTIGDIPSSDALATLSLEGRRGADKNDFTDLLAFVRSYSVQCSEPGLLKGQCVQPGLQTLDREQPG